MGYEGFQNTIYGSEASSPVTAPPLAIVATVHSPGGGTVLCATNRGSDNESWRLDVNSGLRVNAIWRTGGANTQAQTALAFGAGAWVHVAAAFPSDRKPIAWHSGGNKNTAGAAAAADPSGIDGVGLGVHLRLTINQSYPGKLANVALLSVVPSDAEIALHATGLSPLLVWPRANILRFYQLIDSASKEAAGNDLTLTGAPSVTTHPSGIVTPPVRYARQLRRAG